MKKRTVSFLLAVLLLATMMFGCATKDSSDGGQKTETPTTADAKTTETTPEKTAEPTKKLDLRFYGLVVEYTSGPLMAKALQEQFKDKYNVETIQVDWTNLDKVVRTGIASGDPCDVYCIDTGMVKSFAEAAVELTPYLQADPEWNAAVEDMLSSTTVDGKVYAVPWEVNFPIMLANKTIFDAAGVAIPEKWTYAELAEACAKLKAYGVFPIGHATDLSRADWMWRYGILAQTKDTGNNEAYRKLELPLDGEDNTRVLETIKSFYDNKYMYPGEGAVTVKTDEIKAAFSQGKVAMMTEIAAGSKTTADAMKESGLEVVVVPWPSMGETRVKMGTGGNCLFVPSSSKNIDAAVELVKAFTSTEIQSIHAQQGYVSVNKNVKIDDPFVNTMLAQTGGTLVPGPTFTAELKDYKNNNLLPDLILNGGVKVVTENMEKIRKASVK